MEESSACELCGKKEPLVKTKIEGSLLSVCSNCAKFGKIIEIPMKKEQVPKKAKKIKEYPEVIILSCAKEIKEARQKQKLTQKELAEKINEKESLIRQLESGHLKPTIALAKKLERNLNIKLIQEVPETEQTSVDLSDPGLTIGDLLKIKK